MNIIYALIIGLGMRHSAPAYTIHPGTVHNIPQSVPHVLAEYHWAAS